jgi:hypothetical protein
MKKIIPTFLLSMTAVTVLAQEQAQQSINVSPEGDRVKPQRHRAQ